MNDVTVKIPDGLERTCQVEIEAGDTLDNTTSFESAIARLQERLRRVKHPAADERARLRRVQNVRQRHTASGRHGQNQNVRTP